MNCKTALYNCQVGIIGLGLMGASIALALRGKCQSIFGVDSDIDSLNYAVKHGIIDQGAQRINKKLQMLDILILAVPVKSIISIIPTLPQYISQKTLIIDIGSTKRDILNAFNNLPDSYKAVGGHPMCGKALGGIIHAEARLFNRAPFFLIKSRNTSDGSTKLAEDLVKSIGAKAHWIAAETHDHMTAGTSHLPYLLSCALIQSTPISFAKLIGPGFQSSSRLAGSPPTMMGDILETNQDEVLKRLDVLLAELYTIRNYLAKKEYSELKQYMIRSSRNREKLYKASER